MPENEKDSAADLHRSEARRISQALVVNEKPTRKNHYLYQSKIDMAKEILHAETETEALDAALDLVIYGEALARGTEEMEDEEYRDILGLGEEVP